ncbi:hypothetical protein SAMN05216371_0038 [Streptomyces sp. TLI_053]|uniref:hypothetical protein n=1 Tax=Streptomyces sp. TLI_053 TaxID=1855352 RepID=UPI000879905A|nr:hypothetical protein [Streptomyces sp. TLI_053]SDS49475.1 hypothetical protein SAMN05216371_0038 [Streptomyces sp. TLI_053]
MTIDTDRPRVPAPTLLAVVRRWFDPTTARGLILIPVTVGIILWLVTGVIPNHLSVSITWR